MSSAPTQSSRAEHSTITAARPALAPRGPGWRQWLVSPKRERTCLILLAVAVVAAIAVGLNETHGATFSIDEFLYFVVDRGFDFKTLMSPHNGNFTAVIRLLYAIVFKAVGPDYLVFRIWLFVEVAITGILFYVLARRRVGPVAALALTLPLLFLGSSTDVAISTIGVQHLLCVIACLSALLALERKRRSGDVLACLLLTIAVATFSIAFAFIGGVAVSVLLREDRWRRAWIFAIPIGVYLLWLVAAPKYSGPGYLGNTTVSASNIFLIPSFIADAAAAVVAGVTGLSYDFSSSGPSSVLSNYAWGVPLAAAAVVALVWRVRRRPVDSWFWSYLAIPLVFWVSIVMTIEPNRYPNSDRYIYGGAVAVLLLAAEALRGVRLSPTALAALIGASAVALLGNIAQLRVDGSIARASGAQVRAVLAGIDLARDHVASDFLPPNAPYPALMILWAGGVDPYLHAVERHGSFAFTVPGLRQQPASVRELTDSTLVAALRIRLRPLSRVNAAASCRRLPRRSTSLRLRAPGAILQAASAGSVMLGRFARAPTVDVGAVRAGRFYELALPRDRSAARWTVSIPGGVRSVCAVGG